MGIMLAIDDMALAFLKYPDTTPLSLASTCNEVKNTSLVAAIIFGETIDK
jgi:hypothetical protein